MPGSIIAIVFTFVYYWCRGLIGFNKSMEAIPNGFIQMISPILILCFAWTCAACAVTMVCRWVPS